MHPLKLICSLKELRGRIFITWNQYLLSTLASNTSLLGTTVRSNSTPLSHSTPSIRRVSVVFMPTPSLLPMVPVSAKMLLWTLLRLFGLLSRILLSMTKILTLLLASAMLESSTKVFHTSSYQSYHNILEPLNLSTRWPDKNHQFPLFGRLLTEKNGLTPPCPTWSRSPITMLLLP